jgi:hypothetical protein
MGYDSFQRGSSAARWVRLLGNLKLSGIESTRFQTEKRALNKPTFATPPHVTQNSKRTDNPPLRLVVIAAKM